MTEHPAAPLTRGLYALLAAVHRGEVEVWGGPRTQWVDGWEHVTFPAYWQGQPCHGRLGRLLQLGLIGPEVQFLPRRWWQRRRPGWVHLTALGQLALESRPTRRPA